jgi:hypothetical protein
MANNIIAYIGIDNFDNIIYLSRILMKLGKKVLIVDHSETRSLTFTIPQPEGVSCEQNIVTYQRVDFTAMTITKDMVAAYDDILIAFGFMEPMPDIEFCNRIVLVTNLYRFNYEKKLNFHYYYNSKEDTMKSLLVKDVVVSKITADIIVERMNMQVSEDNISVLYLDERDYLNGLICHYNGAFRFHDISKQHKNYLIEEAGKLYPEIDCNLRKAACRQAGRGD